MLHLDGLRNVMNQQGISRQSIDSSDSNSSCVSSPGSASYPPIHPTSTSTPGEIRAGVMLPWTQGGGVYPPPPPENSDEEDEYRPFTPPPPRERLSYTRYQLELLNAIYGTVKYPNSTQKQLIAKRVGITRDQVKIWFQNRRRKDVVGKQEKGGKDEKETESPEAVKPDSASVEKTTSSQDDKSEKTEEDPDETVLPVMVMKSVIAELKRFEKDPLKNKNKKKSRKRPATSQAVGPKPPQPLFQAYDMISPPNRVTPSAFTSAAPNRFHHSKASSAFHNPRDAKHPSQMMFQGQSYLHGMHPPPSASSISVFPNDYVNPPNTTAPPPGAHHNGGHSLYESIPVLADLLGYRTHVDVARQREHALHQPHVPTHCATSGRSPENPASDATSPPTHSAIGLNRVFPFPFIADPPVMLSSIRPNDTYRPQLHYQPPSYSEDPYQPLVISSLSNPYYSSTSPAAWSTSQSHTDSSVTSSSYAH